MPHPDSNATQIDHYEVSITLEVAPSLLEKAKQCEVINSVYVMRTSNNEVDYVIDASATTFDQNGDGEAVDESSASQIFELASIAAVQEGVARSHTSAPSCSTPAQATVYVEGCVSRANSGVSTVISACSGTTMGHRVLDVCTPVGPSTVQITVSTRSQPVCSGGCEPTCNQP